MMHSRLQQALAQRRAFKVISGLSNRDANRVGAVVQAAAAGGATFVDIAADPNLVALARKLTNLPVCASAVEAAALERAVEAGADAIEIGNFDSLYAQGYRFEADDVLALTRQTRKRLPEATLSVTVPHILALDEQAQLAEQLVAQGADLIQTEGGTSSTPERSGTTGLIEKATPTLAATYTIAQAVSVPVLCASGLSRVTAPMAIAAGASGVGIGSAINQLDSEVAMVAAVRDVAEALTGRSAPHLQAREP